MLLTALILFGLAALGGTALLWMHLQNDDAPLGIAALHGLLGAAGLVVLLWTVLQRRAGSLLWASVLLFALAAVGGLVLITNHLRGNSLSPGLMYGHGGAAVVAFVLLIVSYLG